MRIKRDIEVALNFVSYEDAEQNDDLYFSKFRAED